MARYTDGEDWYDCAQFEGMLFTVTANGSVAEVDLHPTVKVTVLETESYYDPRRDTMEHIFDVYRDGIVIVVKISVFGREIKEIIRFC
ncbi:hypothetical protein COCNU_scaffold008973G000010 [Cocos nucifera]|nr:hypothetical protein [Cocos nucifera]